MSLFQYHERPFPDLPPIKRKRNCSISSDECEDFSSIADFSFLLSEEENETERDQVQVEESQTTTEKTGHSFQSELTRFSLGRSLGESLQGQVRYAIDKNTQREVAIKISSTLLVNSGQSKAGSRIAEDFQTEVKLLEFIAEEEAEQIRLGKTMLGASNITRLVAKGGDEKNMFVAMELCEKGELFSILFSTNQKVQLNLRSALKGIASGLHFLHSLNIAHRDMSLENVLVGADNNPKICDFGVACLLESSSALVTDKVFRGKLAYASPQLHFREPYNPFTNDIWCLGIMLFRFAFLRDPWDSSPRPKGMYTQKDFFKQLKGLDFETSTELLRFRSGKSRADPLLLDLIAGMLRYEENQRFTITQVLSHGFFS
jgi:serine/threonine protein kinase